MNERVKELRATIGLSQEDFAAKLGLTRGAITNIELNKVAVKDKLADLICRVFGVSEAWLRYGIEPMFPVMTRKDEIAAFVAKAMSGDPDEQFKLRVISFLSKLEYDEWQMLERFCDKLADENKGRE